MGDRSRAVQAILDLNDDDFEDAVLALLEAATKEHRATFLAALRPEVA